MLKKISNCELFSLLILKTLVYIKLDKTIEKFLINIFNLLDI